MARVGAGLLGVPVTSLGVEAAVLAGLAACRGGIKDGPLTAAVEHWVSYRLLPCHAAAPGMAGGRPSQGQAADALVTHKPARAGKSCRRRQGKRGASVGTRPRSQAPQVSVRPPVQPNCDSRAIQAKPGAQNKTLLGLADKLGVKDPRLQHRHGSGAGQLLNQAGDTPALGDVQPGEVTRPASIAGRVAGEHRVGLSQGPDPVDTGDRRLVQRPLTVP
jgi:hypothetical protein